MDTLVRLHIDNEIRIKNIRYKLGILYMEQEKLMEQMIKEEAKRIKKEKKNENNTYH